MIGVAQHSIVKLSEWDRRVLPGCSLTRHDWALAEQLVKDGKLLIRQLHNGLEIETRSWIGVLRLENVEIRITPKLAGHNLGLIQMLELTSGIDSLKRVNADRDLPVGFQESLLDLIALLLAIESERLIRDGLVSDYVEREDDLQYLRGRLLPRRQILDRYGQLDRLICRFDEREQDVIENRLVAAALRLCGRHVSSSSVKRRVLRVYAVFRNICDPDSLGLDLSEHDVSYNRSNDNYREAHQLSWLVLRALGVKNLLETGSIQCFAFMIDMNRLFEQFAYALVKQTVGDRCRLSYQHSDRSVIWNATTRRPYTSIIPDILVESKSGQRRAALDAKYKKYDERRLSMGDIQQSFLYGYAYGGRLPLERPAAVLLYPATAGQRPPLRLRIQCRGVTGAEIAALGIPISAAIREMKAGRPGPVMQSVSNVVHWALVQDVEGAVR